MSDGTIDDEAIDEIVARRSNTRDPYHLTAEEGDAFVARLRAAESRVAAHAAMLEKARKALEPFAEAVTPWNKMSTVRAGILEYGGSAWVTDGIQVGHLRAAARVLAELSADAPTSPSSQEGA